MALAPIATIMEVSGWAIIHAAVPATPPASKKRQNPLKWSHRSHPAIQYDAKPRTTPKAHPPATAASRPSHIEIEVIPKPPTKRPPNSRKTIKLPANNPKSRHLRREGLSPSTCWRLSSRSSLNEYPLSRAPAWFCLHSQSISPYFLAYSPECVEGVFSEVELLLSGVGGIHFEDADLRGREMGRLIGEQAWNKAQAYLSGQVA
jgi:hypothetical protein